MNLYALIQSRFPADRAKPCLLLPDGREVSYAMLEQGVGRAVTFTPHLVPLDRGILSTIYARVAPGTTEEALGDVLEQAYAGQTFVRLVGNFAQR